MKILSVSTATNHLSVALNQAEQVLAEVNEQDERNHSEHLAPVIAAMLVKKQLKLKDLDRFAVAIGPGSYTGLRIGVTTVKMFASILNIPVVGISTLAALAANVPAPNTLVLALIDARNTNYFAGAYLAGKSLIPDGHYPLEQLVNQVQALCMKHGYELTIVGSGLTAASVAFKAAGCAFQLGAKEANYPHAGVIGRLAINAKPVDPDMLLPNYLRRTQAEADWHHQTGQDYQPDSNYVEEV